MRGHSFNLPSEAEQGFRWEHTLWPRGGRAHGFLGDLTLPSGWIAKAHGWSAFSWLCLLPLSTSSRPTSTVAVSGHGLPCLSPITWGLALPLHPRLSQLHSKPLWNPQVLAISSPEPCSPPYILIPKAQLAPPLCLLPGRDQREAEGLGERMACHCRCRPSPPESHLENPPLIPCFCRKHQPPPASQTRGGSRRLQRRLLSVQAPT